MNTHVKSALLPLVFLVVIGGVVLRAPQALAWDAGPRECIHSECSGGREPDSIPDTQPRYADSRLPTEFCPAGQEWYGSGCYYQCPSGWNRLAVCTCQRGWEFRTNCSDYGYASFPQRGCSADREWYGGLCYTKCPAGSDRTAVSTCTHRVRWRGNTHLWVVNRGIDLLAKSTDPMAQRAASRMNDPVCRRQWEQGIWDADDGDGELADLPFKAEGSHFYNGARKDAYGNHTDIVTYAGASNAHGNARTNAQDRIARIGDLSTEDQCHELGLALHYLGDMTQPMHAASFMAFSGTWMLHPVLEEYVPMIQTRFPVTDVQWDRRWPAMTADQVFHQASVRSNSFAPGLMGFFNYDGTICTMHPEASVTYTGRCFLGDRNLDAYLGAILQDGYQSAASYLYSALSPVLTAPPAPDTGAEIDTRFYYRLTNDYLGGGFSLDTYSGSTNTPFMGQTGNYSGQYWRFTFSNGCYRMTNMFLGTGRSLDTYSNGANQPFMGQTGNYSGQCWYLTRLPDSSFRLMNAFLGATRSLDTYSSSGHEPFMGATGNYSGQHWRLTRLTPVP